MCCHLNLDLAATVLEGIETRFDDGEPYFRQGITGEPGFETERLHGLAGLELDVGATRQHQAHDARIRHKGLPWDGSQREQ